MEEEKQGISIEEVLENENYKVLISRNQNGESKNVYMLLKKLELGSGGFGTAYVGSHINGKFEDFKCIKKSYNKKPNISNQLQIQRLLKELMETEERINYRLDKNIFIAHDIFCPRDNTNYYYSVYDYFNGGNLLQLTKNKMAFQIKWEDEEIQEIIEQLIKQCYYLNEQQIVHRDIKPENVMLHFNLDNLNDFIQLKFHYKLIDFQLAQCSDEEYKGEAGTQLYKAPEPFIQGQDNSKIDIFAVGMIAVFLSSPNEFENAAKFLLIKENMQYIITAIKSRSQKLQNLIKTMVQYKPENRCGLNELLNQRFQEIKYDLKQNYKENIKFEEEEKNNEGFQHANLSVNIPKTSEANYMRTL